MSMNEVYDAIGSLIKSNVNNIHTALPAVIINFNPATCQATVKPTLTFHVADGRMMDYPLISGVPVFMPHAGSAQITYPVKPGDGCLLVFSERSIDEWIGKGSAEQHDPRTFDLTDAFCFVGMRPAQSISADNVELINAGTLVSVTPNNQVNIVGNVNIQGNITVSGTSNMQGKISCAADITAGSVSVQGHTHTGVHGETSSAH